MLSTPGLHHRRFDTVDLLRGISIILVVLLHTWIRTNSVGAPLRAYLPPWLYHLLLQNGDNGVTIFFAVSGFLITYTSIERFGSLAAMVPARFYRIRFARIAPLLLLLLTVLAGLHLAHIQGFVIDPKRETLHGALLSALTFTLAWYESLHGYLPANWDILWSLSVEETFYLVFPLACVLLARRRHGLRWLVPFLIAFVIMGPFGRTIWNIPGIAQEKSYLGGMDAIALGCLTALLVRRLAQTSAPSPRTLLAIQTLGSLLIFWILLWRGWHWMHPAMRFIGRTGLDGTILPLGTCLVILGSVLRGRPGHSCTAPIRWFGRHSYEIYLTHEFLVVWGTELLLKLKRGPLALWFVAILLCTAPLGWLVARFYSEPLNRRLRGGASRDQTAI